MKICNKCLLKKNNKEFWRDKKSPDGLQYRCIDCFLAYKKSNRDQISKTAKRYRKLNKEKISKYFKDRSKNDPIYRLKKNLRTRIGLAIKTNQKKGSMIYHLGCSVEDLKYYLEEQFYNGMNWSNYGKWHIDHIIPLYQATNANELYELCHFSNLQPLWAIDNLRKNKYVNY